MKEHNKGLLKGAIFGTIVGGIAALLLAPKSGKETQEDIKKQAKKVIGDVDSKIQEMESGLSGKIDDLKDVARDLRGEAYEESQRLITRAEILKNDLQDSAVRLAKTTGQTKDEMAKDVKRLTEEGAAVMAELEKMTKHIVKSAGEKLSEKNRNNREED